MPFLIPAVLALSSDVLVMILASLRVHNGYNRSDEDDAWMYHVQYLLPLALLRIGLLCAPLLYHSYHGTALAFPVLYLLFYWGTLIVLCVHELCLLLENPSSLESVVPMTTSILETINHLHALRRIWWMLILSNVSASCHLLLFWHVRSTAPHHAASLRGTSKKQPSIYFALRKQLERQKESNDSNLEGREMDDLLFHDQPAFAAMNSVVEEWQLKLKKAQKEWSMRLEDWRHSETPQQHHRAGALQTLQNKLVPVTPFRVLLQLFANEDVLTNHKLDAAFELDDGASLLHYVPQLLTFLLHGALTNSPQLEDWILERCATNLQFAHRCYWFLRAWCLEVPVVKPSPATPSASLSRSGSSSQIHGDHPRRLSGIQSAPVSGNGNHRDVGLSPFLDEPASPLEWTNDCGKLGVLSSSRLSMSKLHASKNNMPDYSDRDSKFVWPEERQMIESLMMRIKEAGALPAHVTEFGTSVATRTLEDDQVDGTSSSYQTGKTIAEGDAEHSPSDLMAAVESDIIPVHPRTGHPSTRHMDCVASGCKFGLLPLDRCLEARQEQVSHSTEWFDKTPQFLDALIYLADTLFHVPREHRRQELRSQLRLLECELLPSNSIYIPIANAKHSVWRIVADESIAISTKERVPCIVWLEVVDFAPESKTSNPWSLFDKLPRRKQKRAKSDVASTLQSPSTRSLPIDISGDDSTPSNQKLSPSKTIYGSPSKMAREPSIAGHRSEAETIQEWRYGARDPRRATSVMDKLTTTMRDTVKVPLSKVKAQMQGQLSHFRDRSVSEELQSLTMAEALVDPTAKELCEGQQAFKSLDTDSCMGDTRRLASNPQMAETSSRRSRANSGNSVASIGMGQWSSSRHALADDSSLYPRRLDTEVADHVLQSSLSPPYGSDYDTSDPRRLDKEMADETLQSSISLPYGSDHGDSRDEGLRRRLGRDDPARTMTSKASSGRTSPQSDTKPPQVVFRESWSSKEERIRERSALGNHSGWRLLPVLVKANDDLRQEQLAAQLIHRMAAILAREKIPVWLCPYEILALTDQGGLIEAIPDTISLDSLKRNDPNFTTLKSFFRQYYGDGTESLSDAKANFVESLAAYSIVCFLLQIKDRHNGNILLDSRGHVLHIDFGFFFLSSPGKNAGFESAPFKLTRDFVELMDGPRSHLFKLFRELCIRTFLTLRRHCMEIILLVEMIKSGNESLACFRGRPDDAIQQLRERFRLDLNDRACREYVNSLVDDSMENWRTDWYDRYQRYFVGVL